MHYIGILFALLALLSWGFGDFFIQRTSRDYGIWPTTFCITMAGAIFLFPFAYGHLGILFSFVQLPFLLLVSCLSLIVGLVDFDALKIGKIAVIEPIMSFELPLTVLLVMLLLHESMTNFQILLVAFVFGGILLVGYTGGAKARHLLEKGVLLALFAACIQAGVNLTTGLASREVGPVATIWFVHTFIALVSVIYFTYTRSWSSLISHVRKHPFESTMVAILDNLAWVSYAIASVFIPIALAATISESYIVLAILLGVIINRERLSKHQWIGIAISLVAVLILSAVS